MLDLRLRSPLVTAWGHFRDSLSLESFGGWPPLIQRCRSVGAQEAGQGTGHFGLPSQAALITTRAQRFVNLVTEGPKRIDQSLIVCRARAAISHATKPTLRLKVARRHPPFSNLHGCAAPGARQGWGPQSS